MDFMLMCPLQAVYTMLTLPWESIYEKNNMVSSGTIGNVRIWSLMGFFFSFLPTNFLFYFFILDLFIFFLLRVFIFFLVYTNTLINHLLLSFSTLLGSIMRDLITFRGWKGQVTGLQSLTLYFLHPIRDMNSKHTCKARIVSKEINKWT